MVIFVYDNGINKLRIDEHSILLVKEFADLWDPKRNKTKEDPKGLDRTRAYREFTYIYLMLDFKSVYFMYNEQDKSEAAKIDAGLADEELEDELFLAAYRKYNEIVESDSILSLIKVAHRTLYKTQVFLDSIDFTETTDDGKPLYKPSDVVKDIESIAKSRNSLISLELDHKKGLGEKSKVRGDNTPGFADMMD